MGTHVEPSIEHPEVQNIPMPPLQGIPGGAPVARLSYETLVARCPQMAWHPDPTTCFFPG
jgi:hypothetical protein